MAHLRTYDDVMALSLSAAELKLMEACRDGDACLLGDGTRPAADDPDPDRQVRAEILRFLILGGDADCRVSDRGVFLIGARVTGALKLAFCEGHGGIQLRSCTFDDVIEATQLRCKLLDLSECRLAGLTAEGLTVSGNVFLRNIATPRVIRLSGSEIGGQLDFSGAQVSAPDGYALALSRVRVSDGIFLHPHLRADKVAHFTAFSAEGGVQLAGAEIGGLYAEGVTLTASPGNEALRAVNLTSHGSVHLNGIDITGEANFTGARVARSLHCQDGIFGNAYGAAFNAERIKVDQSLIWRDVTVREGQVSFRGAHVAELNDDAALPADPDDLLLDGMTYNRIGGEDNDLRARRKWLRAGSMDARDFYPQPYSQYAKVLRDTGHDGDARTILLERDSRLGPPNRRSLMEQARNPLARLWYRFSHPVRWFIDQLFRWVAGYGHRPFRSVVVLLGLIVLTIFPAHFAWEEGSFAPNSGVILNSEGWQALSATETNPAKVWSGVQAPEGWDSAADAPAWHTRAPGRDWESFNRYAYGVDVVIPIITFGQTDAWAPSTTRGPWGKVLWWARWILSAAGWIVTALGAAAITGLIRRD